MSRLLLVALVVSCWALQADASTCDITEFTSSGTLTAERLNQRIRQTEACINGHIGNANWDSTSPLASSNLATPNAIMSQAWTIGDGATGGSDVGAQTAYRKWRVPVNSTITGMSVRLKACTACSVTVTLQKGGSTVKTFAGIAVTTTQTDFALSSAVTNAQDLTVDISGTMTGVNGIDVVVYEKAPLQ